MLEEFFVAGQSLASQSVAEEFAGELGEELRFVLLEVVAQAGEEWSGFTNRYEYSYRPETVRSSESVPPALGIEILYVYFDAQGAARKIRLLHFGRIFDFSKKDYELVLP